MKKVLVLGSSGMAGHMVYHFLKSKPEKYEVLGISRTPVEGIESRTFDMECIEDDLYSFIDFVGKYKPHVIINCIGVLVQPSEEDKTRAIFINSLFPHALEDICSETNIKVIHISTDCVFDGKNGPYAESDLPTERNWYGRTKALGEVVNDKDLTLRTSIIGPELKDEGTGLFEWFMRQTGEVSGYNNVMWNGITTLELAKQIDKLLDTNVTGLYHLTTDKPTSKAELLITMQLVYGKEDVTVNPVDAAVESNKVLMNKRKSEYDPQIPSYSEQLLELKNWKNK